MGELARKPGAPTLPETPMELLTAKEGQGYNIISYYYPSFLGAAAGVISVGMYNVSCWRPFWAGIHRYILYGVSGAVVGYYIGKLRMGHHNEKEAIYKHYISLHPEDFPPFERKRFKDVFQEWYPIR